MIYRYIFDAKYRIGFSEEGMVGPKEEDINTMHRYRDAIVYENTKLTPNVFEKTMFGAYVLFPYAREEEYKEHPFYKSISTVNIGGLPFLPGTTRLVEQVLTELIEDSEQTAFERAMLPVGMEQRLKRVEWEKKDTLVGSLRDEKQRRAGTLLTEHTDSLHLQREIASLIDKIDSSITDLRSGLA